MKTIRDALGGVHRADAVVSVVPVLVEHTDTWAAEVGIVLSNGHAYRMWRIREEDRQHVSGAADRVMADTLRVLGWEP